MVVAVLLFVAAASFITLSTPNGGARTTALPNGTKVYVFSSSDQSASNSAEVGEVFAIQLSSNAASTAYDWNATTSAGIRYLNYTVVSTSTLVGGPQIRNYFFEAVSSGAQTIVLRDQRPFAPYVVAYVISLDVQVSPS